MVPVMALEQMSADGSGRKGPTGSYSKPHGVTATPLRTKRSRVSAGLLMYRIRGGELEVFIAHPGGPWFPNRDHDV